MESTVTQDRIISDILLLEAKTGVKLKGVFLEDKVSDAFRMLMTIAELLDQFECKVRGGASSKEPLVARVKGMFRRAEILTDTIREQHDNPGALLRKSRINEIKKHAFDEFGSTITSLEDEVKRLKHCREVVAAMIRDL